MGEMIAIKCKSGNIFAACVKEHIDQEWKDEELYYQQQGCLVEEMSEVKFGKCDCDHCKSLLHDFDHSEYE